jgi:hypothetical protein
VVLRFSGAFLFATRRIVARSSGKPVGEGVRILVSGMFCCFSYHFKKVIRRFVALVASGLDFHF